MKYLKLILLAALITLLSTILINNIEVKSWFKKEIRAAKTLNLKVKYMVRPEGLES